MPHKDNCFNLYVQINHPFPSNAPWPQILALPLAADTYGSAWPRKDRVMPAYSMLWKGLLSLVPYS